MSEIQDDEFGTILVKRARQSKSVRAKVTPKGQLQISLPMYVPLFMARRFVSSQRVELRHLMDQRPEFSPYDGMPIGKSHTLVIRAGVTRTIRRSGNQLIVTLPNGESLNDSNTLILLQNKVRQVIRREAEHYLPRRLAHLASTHGYSYETVRIMHAGTRWGSCSSKGTISLNIALMNLPHELIDYVLRHELVHTVEMNHSKSFWNSLGDSDPDYKLNRTKLKRFDPII